MSKKSFSDEELREAVSNSMCLAEVCRKLRLYLCGSSYVVLQRHIVRLNLDTGHWDKDNQKPQGIRPPSPLEVVLVKNSPWRGGTSNLKRKLFKNNLLKNECYICGATEWLDKPLSLQLDKVIHETSNNQ